MVRNKQVSKAGIALAESARNRESAEAGEGAPVRANQSKIFSISNNLPLSTRTPVRLLILIAVSALVLGGVGAGVFFFFKDRETQLQLTPALQKPAALSVSLGGNERRAGVVGVVQKALQALSVPQNEIKTIAVTKNGIPVATTELFSALEAGAPPELARALGYAPVLGVHGFRGGQPFLLFPVVSYDRAFAGMLAWETTLLADIGPLFGVSARAILSDVGSTTADALGNTITVKDVIIRNKDARAAFAPSGDIVFLYAFIDKQTLALTTNEDTLKMLINKAGGGKLR